MALRMRMPDGHPLRVVLVYEDGYWVGDPVEPGGDEFEEPDEDEEWEYRALSSLSW